MLRVWTSILSYMQFILVGCSAFTHAASCVRWLGVAVRVLCGQCDKEKGGGRLNKLKKRLFTHSKPALSSYRHYFLHSPDEEKSWHIMH